MRLFIINFRVSYTLPHDFTPFILGFAVWSKRSDKEIKKEAKKALASKGVNIPNNVALAINTVFIEKSCSMAVFKKEQEMVYAEYKKWIREQKQKLKKDPLPSVKGELVKVSTLVHILVFDCLTVTIRIGGASNFSHTLDCALHTMFIICIFYTVLVHL